MILHKITEGFVIQKYDTVKKSWIGQDFVAGDEVEWEDSTGTPYNALDDEVEDAADDYLSFEMLQPTGTALTNALKVLVLTPHIRKYLEEHDPKALEQAEAALAE